MSSKGMRNSDSKRPGRKPTRSQTRFLWMGAGVIALIAVVALGILARPGNDEASPEGVAIAEQRSGGPVRVLTGAAHTVYHSELPLPSSEAPQSEGKPTLVLFSGTWCTVCELMDPFVYETAGQFGERLVFVEKSVDHDRENTARYRIRGTPTFVLIDATGDEVGRFGYQRDGQSFASTISELLSRSGV